MLQLIQSEFVQSFKAIVGGVADVAPKLIAATLFVIVGWIFGVAVSRVVTQLVEAIKADEWLAKAGVTGFLARAGYTLNSGAFFAWIAKLFFIIIFLVAAFDILGLTEVNLFLNQVLDYIPQVIVAAIIFLVASVASDLLSGAISGATRAIGSRVSNLLGGMTRWAIWMFAIFAALTQLGIAAQLTNILFIGLVAMLALAGGLAFGLGGKEAAAELIKEIRAEMKHGK